MPEMNLVQSINNALDLEMERDSDVVILGEDVGKVGGVFRCTQGLYDKFGEDRVMDTPLAETGIIGTAIGMALYGLRPVPEIQFSDFIFPAFDQIVSNAAKVHSMSGGAIRCPIVFRGPNGAAKQVAAQHSHTVEALYTHFPGLHVLAPSTPRDAKGLLKAAIRDDNPIIFLEGETLYGVKGEVPDEGVEEVLPIGKGRVAREGDGCTVVTWGRPYYTVMEAAERLAADGIELEVIDPRTLRPLDEELILESVRKTNRCVVVHEHWPYGGPGAQIVDVVQRDAFDYLDAPVLRVAGLDVPMPYASNLEDTVLPTVDRVVDAVRRVTYTGA